jgi:RNA polymerase sigma factor (sigma-70 family)
LAEPHEGNRLLALPISLGTRAVSETVLHRVAAGEPAAVEECLQAYGGLVWAVARRFCPNYADAEDAVQDVFIEIWRTAGRFDAQISSEATYISMIARRRLIDRYRKSRRELDTTAIQEGLVGASDVHVEQAEIGEEAARAREQLRKLRPEERQVLELSIHEGMSHSEIAAATNLPLGTVKTHARRGMIRLRKLLGADPVGSGEGGSNKP